MNPNVPSSAPAGYSIEPVVGKGRSLIARRSYAPGDRIFLESPMVVAQYSWNRLYGYAACDNCLRPLETLEENLTRLLTYRPDQQLNSLPDHDRLSEMDSSNHVSCPRCGSRYCCSECRDEAWSMYHRLLCFPSKEESENPVLKLDALWRTMHYPPETASIHLIVRLMAVMKSTDTPQKKALLEAISSLKADVVDAENGLIHKILRDDFQSQLQQLTTVLWGDFKFLQPDVDPWLVSVEWLTKVFVMIGLNGQGIGGSPFNRYVTNFQKEHETSGITNPQADAAIDELYGLLDEKVGLEFLNSEGTALYALQSSCNHSCDPNAKIEFPFNNATLALVATKSIEPGQEVSISYLDECQLSSSRHSRRRALLENYLFACECPKCEKELADGQPDVTSSEDDDDMDDE